MDNQKNLLIAVVLSVVILVGFDFFFKPEKKQFQENGSIRWRESIYGVNLGGYVSRKEKTKP